MRRGLCGPELSLRKCMRTKSFYWPSALHSPHETLHWYIKFANLPPEVNS